MPDARQSYIQSIKDHFRLLEEESSEKESDSILVLLERDYRPCRGGNSSNFLTCPPFGTHERQSFFREFGSAHVASAEDNEP